TVCATRLQLAGVLVDKILRFFANYPPAAIIRIAAEVIQVSTPRLAAMAVIFVLASSFLSAEETCGDLTAEGDQTRYELRNVSGHHSPIQIDGYLTLRDDAAAHVRVYWVHALARNVAKKKISYWSVGFETNGSNPGLNFTQSNDYFFTGDVFAPGQT